MIMKRKRILTVPFFIGLTSLLVVVVFGVLLIARIVSTNRAPAEQLFERIDTAAEGSSTLSTDAVATTADTDLLIEETDEPAYYYNEQLYLSRGLSGAELALDLADEDDFPRATARTTVTTTARTTTTTTATSATETVRYAAAVVNMRQMAAATAPLVRELSAGEKVAVLSHYGEWTQVRTHDGATGYVLSQLLVAQAVVANPTTAATTSPTTTSTTRDEFTAVDTIRYVQANEANVRSMVSLNASILFTLQRGTAVRVTGTSLQWSRINVDGKIGYIHNDLLAAQKPDPVTPAPTTPPTTPPTSNELVFTAVDLTRYTAVSTNVRSLANTSASILTTLAPGTTIRVTGIGGSWSRVSVNGQTGYVMTNLLTDTVPTTPPTTAAPTEPAFTAVSKVMYTTTGANVRQTASTSGSILVTLQGGVAVNVTGIGQGWTRILLSSGTTGYVSSGLLSDTKPVVPETTTPPTSTNPPAGGTNTLNFTNPGTTQAAVYNFNLISPYLKRNGDKSYASFVDNGNGTITVDGLTFSYTSVASHGMTHYDGVAVSRYLGENPPRNRPTSSGIMAQRGIVAMKLVASGGLPFGTVVFVEGYGLAIVGDRGLTGSSSVTVDLCYDADESPYVRPYGWAIQRMYVIAIP